MNRVLRRMVAALWLVASALAAQESAEAPTSFLIETITVENAEKISPRIVVAESLLRENESYTEAELRDAVHRIVRLPFILDADFSLRRGTERGRYELVISVDETRRWFFGFDATTTFWENPISINGLTTNDQTQSSVGLVGRRWSVGREGLLFLALGGNYGTLTLGYQHFDLFDRNVFLSITASGSECGTESKSPDDLGDDGCRTELLDLGLDPTLSTWSFNGDGHRAEVIVGVPLAGNQSIRALVSRREIDGGLRGPAFAPRPDRFLAFSDFRETGINLSWVYNSVDDPVFPTAGTSVEAGVDYRRLGASLLGFDLAGPDTSSETRNDRLGLLFVGTRYRPLTPRHTAWLSVRAFAGRSDIRGLLTEDFRVLEDRLDVLQARVTLGHAFLVLRSHKGGKARELRWESSLAALHARTTPDFGSPNNPAEGFQVKSGIAYRNRWGVFRFNLAYFDLGAN